MEGGDRSSDDPFARYSLRVMSYNILAEIYANQGPYPYAESWELAWSYRRERIVKEIMEADADLICLQVRH